ncbi:ectonucleotide pyrophosphatase/phosphodiesterase [Phenylobacterium sp.]|uniref:alkaline phosphatase family protein n=1 Tax=Phenylobacterium sp. TaxID=1871053 RepID=UPI002736A3AC|nr:ectonucleotide pyrophosphatase/phosphodiesterase [Phenylobacterium sp.]MDP3635583.1 ectonucleotide pyrophosphatase/phosphodiesterase [Phenylobacterium sp.]
MRLIHFMLAACLLLTATPSLAAGKPLVILISMDGFRADYLDRGITPNLSRLAAEGARGAVRPSFPSKTYPNHLTLVTGLRPDRHGLVDNVMVDPLIPGVTFTLGDRATVKDPRWWNDATPLWVTAERQGVISASVYWPGSETMIQGAQPTYWLTYDQTVAAEARVDRVLAWLDLPADRRPGFISLYFDETDTAGHHDGPDSEGLNAAVARTDAAIGRLTHGLAVRGLAADLVITADHGMAAVSAERAIYIEDILPDAAARRVAMGAFMTVIPAPGREAEVERALLARHAHMTCWRKGQIPARYHFGTHRRIPPIFCLPRTGWVITTRVAVAKAPIKGGAHGFDPYAPEMAAVLVAQGPHIRRGVKLRTADNVDVYPLVARLLGVTPEKSDGKLSGLKRALDR